MNNKDIKKILSGGVAIIPTDTVYGLATLPKLEYMEKLYSLKKRNKEKKIIALISNYNMIKELTNEKIDINLINTFLPGPLTIVCKSNDRFKNIVGDTIGFRIPNSKICLDILDSVGGILMTTSANISGEKSATRLDDISEEIQKGSDVIICATNTLSGIPSTIISYIDGEYKLLREGEIKFQEILKIGGKIIESKNG